MNKNKEDLIKKHKKFFETPKPFPLVFKDGDQEIEMIQYKIFKTDSNWGFLFFPYNLTYLELYKAFQNIHLMDNYRDILFDGIKKYLKHAHSENAYVMYSEELIKEKSSTRNDPSLILESVTNWKETMAKLKEIMRRKEELDNEIMSQGYFNESTLEQYAQLKGEAVNLVLIQAKLQLDVHYSALKVELDHNASKYLREMHKQISSPQSEIDLKNSINKIIKYEEFKNMSREEIVDYSTKKDQSFVKNLFNEKHFKSVVRNPTVK